jgi:hypothetical protein
MVYYFPTKGDEVCYMFVQNRRVANAPLRLVAPQRLVTRPVSCVEQAVMSSLSSPWMTS